VTDSRTHKKRSTSAKVQNSREWDLLLASRRGLGLGFRLRSRYIMLDHLVHFRKCQRVGDHEQEHYVGGN
jgi:hypothetical protein